MIKALVTDFSKVLLFAKDSSYSGGLNALNKRLLAENPSYPFFDHFMVNSELLDYYRKLNSDVPVYVFTTGTIQNHPAIKELVGRTFRRILSAEALNLSKADRSAYITVARELGYLPDEIVYVDDQPSNVERAADAGMTTVLFTDNKATRQKIDALMRNK